MKVSSHQEMCKARPMPNETPFEVTLEEFYQIIGELEVVRRKQAQQLQALYTQIGEMSQEIGRLKVENGRLGKPESNE